MTAPALGHRPPPPNSGPDMPFYDDYTHPDNRDISSPLSDSAIRAVNNSTTSDHPTSPPPSAPLHSHGLPSLSSPFSTPSGGIGDGFGDGGGMAGIKAEPDDETMNGPEGHQTDLRRQSAASALLAQLLGNQSTEQPSSADVDQSLYQFQGEQIQQSASAPPAEPFTPNAPEDNHNNAHPTGGDVQMPDYPPLPSTEDFDRDHHSAPAEQASGHDQFSVPADLSQQDEHNADIEQQGPFTTNPDDAEANAFLQPPPKTSDPSAIESLTDPLLMAKTNLDQGDYFNGPFDIAADPKTPFGDLEHNEMLTAAYLSQNADLSALGLSGDPLHQDGTGSVDGSEPRIQAFAKLEFDDGHFYCNTYSFVLGRDVRAARAAHQREFQVRQAVRNSRPKSSSGGNASHTPIRVKHEGSGILGSVVSDRGGIMGFDPEIPSRRPMSRRSSNSSFGESGPPLLATPAQLQSTDYNALAMQSLNESNDAKPVDALALLPSPDSCPTIPIHPPATVDGSAAGHRGISRKHVKIAYNFDKSLFEMEVMGRNGAFIGADWLSPSQIRPLHSGDYIQIGGVRIRFLLPDVPIGETGAERTEEQYMEDDENAVAFDVEDINADGTENRGSDASKKDASKAARLVLKNKDTDPSQQIQSSIEGDSSQQPARRRGPGRPPKDGIMSKRERAELAREQKLAAKREANGGVTPPPQNKPKAGKTPAGPRDSISAASGQGAASASVPAVPVPSAPVTGGAESPGSKPEKRKYTKRKKADGTLMDTPLPSTEGSSHFPMEQRPEEFIKAPPLKKRKPSRSPSPNYPPESAYTPEDLAKPPYNYAVLIFDALTDAGTPMTLKQIYRALKLKYPYFRFKCETEGWTSSVRHNLNGNSHLFMHAERDGKGWSWQLRPGASVEKEKKRRPSPPPPSSHTPVPSTQPYMAPPGYASAANGQANMVNQHFQFPPSMAPNPYAPPPAPAPAPGPPPVHAPAPAPPPPQAPAQQPPTPQQTMGPSPSPAPAPTQGPAAPGQALGPPPASAPTSTTAPVPNSVPAPHPAPAPAPAPPTAPPSAPQTQPQPQHTSPYPPPAPLQPPQAPAPAPAPAHNPVPTPAPFSIPSPIRNSLPRAFAQTVPTTYTSPYAFDPPPQLAQFQQSHQQSQPLHAPPPPPPLQQQQPPQQPPQPPQYQQPPQPHPQPAYPPAQNPAPMPIMNHQPQGFAPNPGHPPMPPPPPPPPPQEQQQPPPFNAGPAEPSTGPMEEDMSFKERAGKAIDDFEAVLMEDYDDKNYIREVLRSARARVLGDATESSFPGGEPKDEAVIYDALRNLVGSLEG